MAENTNVKDKAVDVKVEEEKDTSVKRFTINVDSGSDEEGNKKLFSFSGPENASLGLIYDAVHRIMLEVISILQRRAEELKPRKEEDVKSEDEADKKEK